MLYKFCPQLPQLPKELIDLTEDEIRNIPNKFNGGKSNGESKKYTLHTATQELQDFLRPYFDSNFEIAFQIISNELPIHKDYGRTNCYNYVIKSGGDVSTVWYDDNLNEIDRIIFLENSWHNINVSTFHNVKNLTSTRVAVSVWKKDNNAIGKVIL